MDIKGGKQRIWVWGLTAVFLVCNVFVMPQTAYSESTADLKDKILTIAEKREALETEMQTYSDQKKFLEEKILASEKNILETQDKISENERLLKRQKGYLSEYLKVLYEEEQVSFFEQLMKAETFSDFVDKNEYYNTIKDKFKSTVENIAQTKKELEDAENKLIMEKKVLEITKVAYQKQINEKSVTLEALKEEERVIREKFADRLSKAGVSPYCKSEGKIIKAKYSIFKFPIDCGYISQGFGNTTFASIDRAYNGAIHNGVDVGIGTGVDIHSIGNGVVYAKGATPSGGWGNWVMIKHDKVKVNVAGTEQDMEFYSLYGHMATETFLNIGDPVTENTVVGWVSGTPYWAPHLHFSLFVSSSGWGTPQTNTIGPYPGNVIDPLDFMDIPISISGTDWDPNFVHFFK